MMKKDLIIKDIKEESYNAYKHHVVGNGFLSLYPDNKLLFCLNVDWWVDRGRVSITILYPGQVYALRKEYMTTVLEDLMEKVNEFRNFYDNMPEGMNKQWFIDNGFSNAYS